MLGAQVGAWGLLMYSVLMICMPDSGLHPPTRASTCGAAASVWSAGSLASPAVLPCSSAACQALNPIQACLQDF